MYANRAGSRCTAVAQGAQAEEEGSAKCAEQNQQINAKSTANSLCIVNLHYHISPTSQLIIRRALANSYIRLGRLVSRLSRTSTSFSSSSPPQVLHRKQRERERANSAKTTQCIHSLHCTLLLLLPPLLVVLSSIAT